MAILGENALHVLERRYLLRDEGGAEFIRAPVRRVSALSSAKIKESSACS